MLNHIVVMGRLTRDPELRKTASGVSVASFSVAVDRDFSQQRGAIPLSLRQSISQKAARLSFPAVCRSGTGRIKKATNAARRRSLLKTSILATARRRTTAVLPPHPRRASVRQRSRAALCPTLAAPSLAALCRTLVEDTKTVIRSGGNFLPKQERGNAVLMLRSLSIPNLLLHGG